MDNKNKSCYDERERERESYNLFYLLILTNTALKPLPRRVFPKLNKGAQNP